MSRPILHSRSLLSSTPTSSRSQCLHLLRRQQLQQQQRAFTQSRPAAANVNMINARHDRAQRQSMKGPPQQSLTVVSKKHTEKAAPNDLGLMLGTLIMPPASKRGSLFSHPIVRTRLEIARIWKRINDLASVVTTTKFMQKPRAKIQFGQTKTTAMALHRQMYTAFAEGDNLTINSICTEGLRDRFRARISLRKPGEKYVWTLHDYVGRPRVMSHRATVIPIEDALNRKSSMRQAVVRIRSRQSLTRTGRAGVEVVGEQGGDDVKEITEFVVIQKRLWKGTDEKWKVWGTTEETSAEGMREALHPKVPEVKDGKIVSPASS